ncbi:NAD(P)/FAD-dependent oxidoreductase [Bradyrhizobium sp. SZCCHNS3002]|uniref:NAD(P)/FAD-dependent oxidoreductase n=1 Tax=Bradyrhizobium sp. SZCCHNS3002 TaxID=3057310 RepID=UPI0028EC8775|nr:FAD-dependent oxidoreductase [Bradyrhizobium sp. SZCCHNS3002]
MKPDAFDVVILGAGVAGCATALALHAAGITDIAVVEAASSARNDWVGESLPPDVSELLKALDMWDRFRAAGHEPCLGSCASWGSPLLGYNDFLTNISGCGWHIHRPRFDASFREAVAQRGIPIRPGHRLAGAEALILDSGFRLHLRTHCAEIPIVARHVVDATGPRAAFARCIGSSSIQHDLLVFITATAALAPGAWPSRLTMTETAEAGWWYAAGLPGNRLSLAFATDPEISRTRRLDHPTEWLNALAGTRHIAPRLANTPFDLGPLIVRAAPVTQRQRPCGARWTGVGDAASIFDPLGSEGIYKALEDGIRAAEVIHASLRHGQDRSADYAARIAANTEDHLNMRRHFYALERQWPDSPFWTRRHIKERSDPSPARRGIGL